MERKVATAEEARSAGYSGRILDSQQSCDRKCSGRDCIIRKTTPVVLSRTITNDNKFELFMSYLPKMTSAYKQKVNLAEYLSHFCGAIGFWLGLSVLQLLDSLHRMLIKGYQMKNRIRTEKEGAKTQRRQNPPAPDWYFVPNGSRNVMRNPHSNYHTDVRPNRFHQTTQRRYY